MNKTNQELLQLLAIPAMMLACGLSALALATLVQALSGEPVGVGGFAVPTILASLVGMIASGLRLMNGPSA